MTNDETPDHTSLPEPLVQIGDFAILEVVALEEVGAFLDWGLPKDLFLPFAEQLRGLRIGQHIVVYVYLDNTNRPAATMRLEKHFESAIGAVTVGEAVALTVYSKTEMGYKCIVNGRHQGLLFANEVFQSISYADELTGYVKNVREDGKLDLSLNNPTLPVQTGHKAALGIGPKILEALEAHEGFMAINDRTEAEKIYELFGVSKKKFKIALGDLYKRKLITVEDAGIRLVKAAPGPQSPQK
jgi:hypothetical protein